MNIVKIETNFKRNIFLKEKEVKPKKYIENLENQIINIYTNIKEQNFIGFGGAITQSTGKVYNDLPQEKKKEFLNDYFKTCRYNLCRLPIGSCDFSDESYSYSYEKDLSDFSIEKDKEKIIPLIKDILELNPEVKFLASPWSPPKFMKTNKMLTLGGKLKKEYYLTYARYIVKYLERYKDNGIKIDFVTIQNEPNATQIWESCLFSADEEADFLKNYLYPTFKDSDVDTKILIYDHNKEKMYTRAKKIFESTNYADGIAYHWYTGDHFENLEILRKEFPNKLLIHTEGCVGYSKFRLEDEVKNAEIYAHDIIGDLNNGCNGYIDWNMLLDNKGGPNHKFNYCNSPIMANKENTDFYKNLCYYYIAQFGKVIKPNAIKIGHSKYTDKIEVTSFENEDGTIGIVLLNRNENNYEYNLCIDDIYIHDNLDSHAIVSYIIEQNK